MAKKLDYNAPFATVHGIGSAAAYSQNGVYFSASGVEVDLETGEEVFDEGSAPDAEAAAAEAAAAEAAAAEAAAAEAAAAEAAAAEAAPSKKTKATVTSADVI